MQCILRDVIFVSRRVVDGRRKDGIQSYSKCILDHTWYNSLQNRTINFKTWISIYLNEPRFEVTINHKVKAKNLKITCFPIFIKKTKSRSYGIASNLLQPWINLRKEIIFDSFRVVSGQTV